MRRRPIAHCGLAIAFGLLALGGQACPPNADNMMPAPAPIPGPPGDQGPPGPPGTNANVTAGDGVIVANGVVSLDTAFTDSLYWKLGGNTGTSAGADVIGTTDNQALERHVDGARALRLEPAAGSPNLIGGFDGNTVETGAVAATIAGGGPSVLVDPNTGNRVFDNFGTIGAGGNNQAGDDDGIASRQRFATVGGGRNNTASGDDSTVGGGDGNTASASRATVGGGRGNVASGSTSTIGGGQNNTASFNRATVGGGLNNTASFEWSTVGGGVNNVASGRGSIVPGGINAVASHHGQMAHAAGSFAAPGDAQTSVYVMRVERSDQFGADLSLGGGGLLSIADDQTIVFDILYAARSNAGQSAGYRIRGVVENVDGNTTFVGTPIKEVIAEDDAAWDVRVVIVQNTPALRVQAFGSANTTIRWVATVRTTEVTFPVP